MSRRQKAIIRAILKAMLDGPRKYSILQRLLALFAVFNIPLQRFEQDQFRKLRQEIWGIDEADYWQSFEQEDESGRRNLTSLSELGFSGSTFFETLDHKYLIKSLPRGSESAFFKEEMREPYYHYMKEHPQSLLVRITDFLHSPVASLGAVLKVVPKNHVVLENLLHGKSLDSQSDTWEEYDLKPRDYFYPERDVLNGQLTSEATQNRLVDHFKDKIRITTDQHVQLQEIILKDTEFLKSANTVDYSLFLVRYPRDSSRGQGGVGNWRDGIVSKDNQWIYRAVILDFFFARHHLPAKAFSALVRTYNTIDNQGPMSLTTSADEFAERFKMMVNAIIDSS